MFPRLAISNRHPFAPCALPQIIAPMGSSDFRQPLAPSSLFTLVRGCAFPFAPTDGSPWLTHHPNVRLDTASDPGAVLGTRQCAPRTVACWRHETIGRHQCGLFGTQHLQGRLHPLPLHLAFFRAYTSPGLLPVPDARLDTRPVASGYPGGIPTRWMMRPCQDAPSLTPLIPSPG